MNLSRKTIALLFFCFTYLSSCSDSEENSEDEMSVSPEVDDPVADEEQAPEEENNDDGTDNNEPLSLAERFIFDENIVIENSYNTGGCDSPPCDTNDESLVGVFVNQVPDDDYFYLSEDESELKLECQLDKGRRIEFKQTSRGPLTSFAQIKLEGIYYDIPNNGVTIAQVHNRGGSSNKPFFRLVLYEDGLETVVRKDPEVSSSDTTFSKEDFSFINQENYDQSSLKVIVEKSEGFVHISVEQNGVFLLEESYAPDDTTDWVSDAGIAAGFYLKAGLYNDDGPHTENLVVGYSTVVFESNDQ